MMSCFPFFVSHGNVHLKSLKKSIQEYKKTKTSLASLPKCYLNRTTSRKVIIEEIARLGKSDISVDIFTYRELCAATQNFNYEALIGEGGFGRVYKGHIQTKDIDVAVKQLDRNGFQGNKEFLVEVLVLSLFRHPNLVNLVGYCAEGSQRILVYEYMTNGSLEDHLLTMSPDTAPLDWNTRMKIAIGSARGLEYLHEEADPPVIYRDFKASNILLDSNFNPKLSDFGFAKLGHIDENTEVSEQIMGTYGYCAPEYISTGQLSTMSDVYSFGVVFLEMITGRRAIDSSRPSEEQNLIAWAEPLLRDRKTFHLVADPLLKGKYPEKALHQALAVAAMCLQEDPAARPLISDVVTALEFIYIGSSTQDDNDEDEDEEDDDDD